MNAQPKGRLILFPVPMGDTPVENVLPAYNLTLLDGTRHFIVENIRSARRFLRKCRRDFPIDDCTFIELSEHTPAEAVPAMLRPIEDGMDVGVISEAGCPAVADPGADVVAVAQSRGYEVVPLVGPSSILMSLMGSGFNGQSFAFRGYLPVDKSQRAATLKEMCARIRRERQTQIFIETPYRNNKLVEELATTLPQDMLLCVASDISGERQSILARPISYWRTARYDYSKIPTIFLLFA